MKNLILVAILALFVAACGSQNETDKGAKDALTNYYTPGNFTDHAGEYVGKEMQVTGVIDHVCSHDGKKMFLVDMEQPGRIRINTGDNMAAFRTEWEGSIVTATGIVEEFVVDIAYLNEWEDELKAEAAHTHEEEEEHEDCEYESYTASNAYKQIERYREMMAEKGTDKLSFYSMKAITYDVLDD